MIITLTTDFGLQDAFVGIMKGVIATINPQVTVVDLTHGVPAQNIIIGALCLRHAVSYFPRGTIHVAVVDPGVGSARLPLLIECDGSYFIGPDNGLLSLAIGASEPDSITCLSNPEYHRRPTSASFHGRDIFAPVAAHLSRGVSVNAFGDPLPQFVRLLLPQPRHQASVICGQIIYIDHFGNLFTNIECAELTALPGTALEITCGAGFHLTGIAPNYSSGHEGELIAIKNSWEVLEIAIPGGNAQQHTGAKIGDQVRIAVRP
jgi:S-adenosylmethionine hydrolase